MDYFRELPGGDLPHSSCRRNRPPRPWDALTLTAGPLPPDNNDLDVYRAVQAVRNAMLSGSMDDGRLRPGR